MPDTSGVCNAVGTSIPLAGPVLGGVCNLATNPAGAVTKAVGAAASSVFGQFAESVGQSAGDLLRTSMTWWVKTDSINIDPAAIVSTQRPLQGVFAELNSLSAEFNWTISGGREGRPRPGPAPVLGAHNEAPED